MRPGHAGASGADKPERSSTTLTLTTGGITLLGVLLSVGVTVGFGIDGSWWLRVLAGVGTTLILVIGVRAGTEAGRGPIARLATWVIGGDDAPRDDPASG